MRQAMDSFLDLAEIVDLKEFIEGWFMDSTSIEDIKHDNMVEFIAYGFYSKELEAVTDAEREEIDSFMGRVCQAFKQKAFEPGGCRKHFLVLNIADRSHSIARSFAGRVQRQRPVHETHARAGSIVP
jgi:hypothetical protein